MAEASGSIMRQNVKFGDVVRHVKTSTKDPESLGVDRVVGLDHLDPGSLDVQRWDELKDLPDGTSFTRVFRRGQVLFGKRRAYQRKVAVAGFDGICSSDILVFEPLTNELLPDFLPYVVQSNGFFDHALGTSAGSLSPRTKWQELAKYEFDLPPTSEQASIVRALRAAAEVVAGYEGLVDAIETQRAALAARVWQLTTVSSALGALADVTVGIVVKPAALYVKDEGVPALRSLNVLPNRLHEQELVRISLDGHQKHSKSRLVGGEVVVVRTGRPGDTAVIPKDGVERNAIDLLIVRCGQEVEAEYLACYLNSIEGRRQMLGRSAGTAQQHLKCAAASAGPSSSRRHARTEATRAVDGGERLPAGSSNERQDRRARHVDLSTRDASWRRKLMFNEANTVEAMVLDRMTKLGWAYIHGPSLGRSTTDVLLESVLAGALVRLNPDIAAQPERADEVIYKLRAVIGGVIGGGLVGANEEFMSWMRGEQSMPFGPDGGHVTIRLVDFDDIELNTFIVANQVTFSLGPAKRFDIVGYINGLPLVLGEAKTPVRKAVTWIDGAAQVHDDYEINVPSFFVPNAFSFATEGKEYRYGSIRLPVHLWAPWRLSDEATAGLQEVDRAVQSMLRPEVVLDITRNFSVFATDRSHRKIKIICRYQQYEAANQILQRVLDGHIRKGLIWHFQGSGKSLLMVFTANKLRQHEELGNPTVVIVVDRIDLDTQITATFSAADVPNMVATESRSELHGLLARDARKVIITTIHKFGEADGVLNERDNIVVLVDEAHRTQEGDLGRQMRNALPNAFLFGLTGTPINTRERNTFFAFGAPEDGEFHRSVHGPGHDDRCVDQHRPMETTPCQARR